MLCYLNHQLFPILQWDIYCIVDLRQSTLWEFDIKDGTNNLRQLTCL